MPQGGAIGNFIFSDYPVFSSTNNPAGTQASFIGNEFRAIYANVRSAHFSDFVYLTAQGAYIKYNKLLEKTWQTEQICQQTPAAVKDPQGQTLTGYFYCVDIVPVNAYGYPAALNPTTQAIEIRSASELKLICNHTNTFHRTNRGSSALLDSNPINGKLVLSIPVNTPTCGYFLYMRIVDLKQFSSNGSMVLVQTAGNEIPWNTMNTGTHVYKRAFAKARSSSALADAVQYEYLSGTQLQQKGITLIPTLGTSNSNYANTANMVRNLLSRMKSLSNELTNINGKSPLYFYHALNQPQNSTQSNEGFDPNSSGTWSFNLQAQSFSFSPNAAFNQAQSFTSFWHDAVNWITKEITEFADLEVKIMVDIAKYSLVGICKAFSIPQSEINSVEGALDTIEHILIKILNQAIHFLELIVFWGFFIEAILACQGYLKTFISNLLSTENIANLPSYCNKNLPTTLNNQVSQQLSAASKSLNTKITGQSRPVNAYQPSAVHAHVFNKLSQHTQQMVMAKNSWAPDTSKLNITTINQAAGATTALYNNSFATGISNIINNHAENIVDDYQTILQIFEHPSQFINVSYASNLVPIASTLLTQVLDVPFLSTTCPIFKDFLSLFNFDINVSLLDFISLLMSIVFVGGYFIGSGEMLSADTLKSILYPSPISQNAITIKGVNGAEGKVIAQIISLFDLLAEIFENQLWPAGFLPDGIENNEVQAMRYAIKLTRAISAVVGSLLSNPSNWSGLKSTKHSFEFIDIMIKSILLIHYVNNSTDFGPISADTFSLLNASQGFNNIVINLLIVFSGNADKPSTILSEMASTLGNLSPLVYFVNKLIGYDEAITYTKKMQLILGLAIVLDLSSIAFADF